MRGGVTRDRDEPLARHRAQRVRRVADAHERIARDGRRRGSRRARGRPRRCDRRSAADRRSARVPAPPRAYAAISSTMRTPTARAASIDRERELVRLLVGRPVGPVVDVVELAHRRVARAPACIEALLRDRAHPARGRARRRPRTSTRATTRSRPRAPPARAPRRGRAGGAGRRASAPFTRPGTSSRPGQPDDVAPLPRARPQATTAAIFAVRQLDRDAGAHARAGLEHQVGDEQHAAHGSIGRSRPRSRAVSRASGIARVGVPHHARARIVREHALDAQRAVVGAVGDDLDSRVDRAPDADAAAVVHGDPGGARGDAEQRVQDRPVGDRVRAVQHALGLAVGRGDGARVEVVAADHDRRADLARAHELVEAQPRQVALAVAEPADARRQALVGDARARQLEPALQVQVVGEELADGGVGGRDVVGIARERRPAERARARAEERPHVGLDEAGVREGLREAARAGLGAQAVAVVEDLRAALLELDHRGAVARPWRRARARCSAADRSRAARRHRRAASPSGT